MIRTSRLVALMAGLALTGGAAQAFAQPETPSSAPAPSPGGPSPPPGAPREGSASSGAGPDRSAAQAAVRDQCTADRARFCPDTSGVGALACLSSSFSKLSPDCQSAVTALKQAQGERGGGG